RLPLLAGGLRDLPERQQALRATMAWSYDLLSDEEQRLFRALGAVPSGCTAELAAALLATETSGTSELDALDGLQALLDQSLLVEDADPDGTPRFRMLGVVREFAEEWLAETGESDARRARVAAALVRAAESVPPYGPEVGRAFQRFDRELDSLRAVI